VPENEEHLFVITEEMAFKTKNSKYRNTEHHDAFLKEMRDELIKDIFLDDVPEWNWAENDCRTRLLSWLAYYFMWDLETVCEKVVKFRGTDATLYLMKIKGCRRFSGPRSEFISRRCTQ
jgi:hypothetical protein